MVLDDSGTVAVPQLTAIGQTDLNHPRRRGERAAVLDRQRRASTLAVELGERAERRHDDGKRHQPFDEREALFAQGNGLPFAQGNGLPLAQGNGKLAIRISRTRQSRRLPSAN